MDIQKRAVGFGMLPDVEIIVMAASVIDVEFIGETSHATEVLADVRTGAIVGSTPVIGAVANATGVAAVANT